ncbi:MAG: hypothetical protein M3Q42_05300 [Pseudomonadota bacterium]|nr:hypothetical protein [Pseudomonadota bacterium]
MRTYMLVVVLALALTLTACKTTEPKATANTEWQPPVVACQQARTPDYPPPPMFWFLDGPAWAVQVLGVAIEERRLRGIEHACMDDHRKRGLIR